MSSYLVKLYSYSFQPYLRMNSTTSFSMVLPTLKEQNYQPFKNKHYHNWKWLICFSDLILEIKKKNVFLFLWTFPVQGKMNKISIPLLGSKSISFKCKSVLRTCCNSDSSSFLLSVYTFSNDQLRRFTWKICSLCFSNIFSFISLL